MSDEHKAVFLSYASQDAEAAKRICDALRQAGVEVWFDQSELRGGDAWDQKIRRQIQSCSLFVPVISAATQARGEGYFRLEWKLAVDRSHLMADDTPFLFPVVIDDTPDSTARVPDRFREVQWTRLNVKDTPETLAARVGKLLAKADNEAGDEEQPGPKERRRGRKRGGKPVWLRYTLSLAGVAIGLVYAIKGAWRSERSDANAPVTQPTPPPLSPMNPPKEISEARQLVARARAMSLDKYDSTADDFAAADNLIKRALELDPNDGEIWAVSSLLNFSFGSRGFDHAASRTAAARSHAERALSLSPDSLEALFALGRWQRDNEEPAVAESTFKKILSRAPDHAGALFNLAWVYDRMDRVDESAALYERSAMAPKGNAALSWYAEYLLFFHRARFEEAERCIRQ